MNQLMLSVATPLAVPEPCRRDAHVRSHSAGSASSAVATVPRVVHQLRGRVRLQLPGWTGGAPGELEARLRQHPGVRKVTANPLTRNVLIHFDPTATDVERLRIAAGTLPQEEGEEERPATALPPVREHDAGAQARHLTLHSSSTPSLSPSPRPPSLFTFLKNAFHLVQTLYGVRQTVAPLGPRGMALLPYLPKIAAVAISLASISSPWGALVAGVESVQLIGELASIWPA